jgi:hypothetical protein
MKKLTILLTSLFLLLSACAPQATATQSTEPQTITIMTHIRFRSAKRLSKHLRKPTMQKLPFAERRRGSALNKAVLTKDAPLADCFWRQYLSSRAQKLISSSRMNRAAKRNP